jgi:3-(3-hydroxy-phenyl)propionate hydroxylase
MLAECGGVVKDTPRQDVLPRLEAGLLSARNSSARGTLFPQPRLKGGLLMDERFGRGWRLVLDGSLAPPTMPMPMPTTTIGTATTTTTATASGPLTVVDLGRESNRECEGVVAAWMRKHEVHAALLRPDHYVYGAATSAADLDALLAEWRAALSN